MISSFLKLGLSSTFLKLISWFFWEIYGAHESPTHLFNGNKLGDVLQLDGVEQSESHFIFFTTIVSVKIQLFSCCY